MPLARSRTIRPRPWVSFETPLLVPSVSSRGYPLRADGGRSEVSDYLEFAAPLISDALLVSAYDLNYGLIPGLDGLGNNPASGILAGPELLFVDSGGYETQSQDAGDFNRFPYQARDWNDGLYEATVARIHPQAPIVITNLDRPGPVGVQIAAARTFFERHPRQVSDLLLKPSRGARFMNADTLAGAARDLAGFDIIGVTEKELGSEPIERLTALGRLRTAMDEAGVAAPIHVFGSLDPLLTPLYFLAGAEIFDGLEWLTHSFRDELGLAVYGDAHVVLEGNWTHHVMRARTELLANNLAVRERVTMRMKEYCLDGRFAAFGPQATRLEEAHTRLRVKLNGGA